MPRRPGSGRKRTPVACLFKDTVPKGKTAQVMCTFCSKELSKSEKKNIKNKPMEINAEAEANITSASASTFSSVLSCSSAPRSTSTHSNKQQILSFVDKITSDQLKANELLAREISASGAPLAMEENSHWLNYFKFIRPSLKIPSRYEISEPLLQREYNNVHASVEEQIAAADSVALMCDGWCNIRNESINYFVVTTPAPLLYKSLPTGKESYTAENIAKEIDTVILRDWHAKSFWTAAIQFIESDKPRISKVVGIFKKLEEHFKEVLPTSPILKKEEQDVAKIIADRKQFAVCDVHKICNLLVPSIRGSDLTPTEQTDAIEHIFEAAKRIPATSLYLYGNQEKHEQLQEEALKYIQQNWTELQQYIFTNDDSLKDLNRYMNYMKKTSTYATSLEALGLSETKNVFYVYHKQQKVTSIKLTIKMISTIINKKEHRNSIHLLLAGRQDAGHFELLTPQEAQNRFGEKSLPEGRRGVSESDAGHDMDITRSVGYSRGSLSSNKTSRKIRT
ncbi:unnamed protein product [Ceutorhynchus assimilis]|uniref:DUF659 domain-containing protein n=1 Tax=Ceutorhynchus assimilis TaxID=467358 RepID=A0A9N9MBH8_9CUCU|nr:unnamed protein product [Ceutorhynchus assimilis]